MRISAGKHFVLSELEVRYRFQITFYAPELELQCCLTSLMSAVKCARMHYIISCFACF